MRTFAVLLLCAATAAATAAPAPPPAIPPAAGSAAADPAAPLAVSGADKPVPVNSFAVLSVNADPTDSVRWKVVPAPVRREAIAGKLVVSGVPGSVHTVYCTVLNFETKRFEELEAELTFAGPPQPPAPPAPADVLAEALRAAYAADPEPNKAQLLASLADVLGGAVRAARDSGKVTTDKQLVDVIHAATDLAVGKGKLANTRKAVGVYLNAALPKNYGELTPELWDKEAVVYAKAAAALKEVTK